MAKYLKKLVTEENTGNQANAFTCVELICNKVSGVAVVKEGGWKDGQALADGKDQCIRPIMWIEPDISALVSDKSYPIGTLAEDILFDIIGTRMVSIDNLPDGSGPNPFKGGTFEDIPEPTQ